jgi:hypothetical protein
VTPTLTAHYKPDHGLVHSVFPRQGYLRYRAGCIPDTDGLYIVIGQLSPAITHSLVLLWMRMRRVFVTKSTVVGPPSFSNHVCGVVSRRAQEQMVRPDAQPHVTVVADEQPFRDCSKVNAPRDSAGSLVTPSSSVPDVSYAITVAGWACPEPAVGGLINVLPESFFQRLSRIRSWHGHIVPNSYAGDY